AVAPPAPAGRSWRPFVIAVVALAVGAAGAYVYPWVVRQLAPGPGSGPVIAGAPGPDATSAAQPAMVPPIDAGPIGGPIDGPDEGPNDGPNEGPNGGSNDGSNDGPNSGPNDGPTDAAIAAPRPPHDHRPPPPPAAPRSSGPPGFITIDSSPVYAVIYIDGKSYGETPLVKIALPPGRHVVHAVAPSGAARDVRITIESGKTAPASRIEW
ncbi:MAG TPA: PEGA domain-containing protein, partial [Kofleriaceae bacterium]|nr:PEGA domain-containing protein [Kofleriaceae bacterium]